MSKTNKILIMLVPLLLAVAIGGAFLITRGASNVAPAGVGQMPRPAPDFSLQLLSGKTVRLSDFRGKKPVVINFWASWCPPCREEAPVLARVSRRFKGQVQFLGIIFQDTRSDAEMFIKEFGIDYLNGMDPGNISASYKVTGVPETYFVDKKGQLVDSWLGAIDEANLVTRIERML